MSLHDVSYAQLGGFYSLNPGIADGTSLNNGLDYKQPVGQPHLVPRDPKGQNVQDIETDPKKDPLVKIQREKETDGVDRLVVAQRRWRRCLVLL